MAKTPKKAVKKATRGRPVMLEGKRSGVFQIRLTDEEKVTWMTKATAAGLSLADWFRMLANNAK